VSRLRSAFRAVGLAETLIVVAAAPVICSTSTPAAVDVHRFARLVEEARRGAPRPVPGRFVEGCGSRPGAGRVRRPRVRLGISGNGWTSCA
jgi:hypothetical protein